MGVFKKMDGNALCALLHKNFEVDNPNRAAVAMQVIERGHDTDDPLAWLACAFAYTYLGAQYRKEAILQFEKYLSAPLKNDDFDLWSVYGTLAELYEAELDFESAERFYILQEQEYKKSPQAKICDPIPNTKLGRLYLKISTAKAVEYWQDAAMSREYMKYPSFRRVVDNELMKAQAKHAKGYTYKPRGSK